MTTVDIIYICVILGCTLIGYLIGKSNNDHWSDFEDIWGAFMGLVIGAVLSFILCETGIFKEYREYNLVFIEQSEYYRIESDDTVSFFVEQGDEEVPVEVSAQDFKIKRIDSDGMPYAKIESFADLSAISEVILCLPKNNASDMSEAVSDSAVMNCATCNHEVTEKDVYCSNCGEKICE